MHTEETFEADLAIGPSVISAYSRLSYTMWYALAEFIDNSTQSRINYCEIVDPILEREGTPLLVEILHDRINKRLTISDNSIGMDRATLVKALKVATPTQDSKGRSRYGMGMKTAACWIGDRWQVVTTRAGSGIELTATIDVNAVAEGGRIPVTARAVDRDCHYTRVIIDDLNRTIQRRTEENIREYLGSMYRFDLADQSLKILYNGEEILPFGEQRFDTDELGHPYRRTLPETEINGKTVRGWIGVLRAGAGGRKYGGFSLFQNKRQIQGYPSAWKPRLIYGGVDDEGANNLIAQRLTGVIELEGFEVSHTKDAVLFMGTEQEELEKFLEEQSRDYRAYASRRRSNPGTPWSTEKVIDLIEDLRGEFETPELRDAAADPLPPLDAILENNERQASAVTEEDPAIHMDVLDDLKVTVILRNTSSWEPYLTVAAGAAEQTLHIIINNLHPYYEGLDSPDAKMECIRQFIYDAIAEYRVAKQHGTLSPSSVKRKKDSLLRARQDHIENAALAIQRDELEAISVSEPD